MKNTISSDVTADRVKPEAEASEGVSTIRKGCGRDFIPTQVCVNLYYTHESVIYHSTIIAVWSPLLRNMNVSCL